MRAASGTGGVFSPVKCILGCEKFFQVEPKGPKMTTFDSAVAGPPMTAKGGSDLAPAAAIINVKKLYSGTKFSHMSQKPRRSVFVAVSLVVSEAEGTTTGVTRTPRKASFHASLTSVERGVRVAINFVRIELRNSGAKTPRTFAKSSCILLKASHASPI